jgi:hypothetical protein
MNRSLCLLSATLVLALLWSQSGYGYGAQKPEGEWDKFWPSFSAAVTKRDRADFASNDDLPNRYQWGWIVHSRTMVEDNDDRSVDSLAKVGVNGNKTISG